MRSKYLLAALLACAPLASQATPTSYTFDSVEGIEHYYNEVRITGVLVNDTVPSTVTLPLFNGGGVFDRCEHLFHMVLEEPSKYTLTVVLNVDPNPQPTFPPVTFTGCKANKKP